MPMSACPSQDRLRQLLADEPGDAGAAAVERHVDGCPHCQQVLAELDAVLDLQGEENHLAGAVAPALELEGSGAAFLRQLEEKPPPVLEGLTCDESRGPGAS